MSILLELPPDIEDKLREIADAQGLTVEGYLLTLAEGIVGSSSPAPSAIPLTERILIFLLGEKKSRNDPRPLAAEASRRMKADLLEHKEQAVEAATKANLLQRIMDRQEQTIAERELQALNTTRDGDDAKALALFQESVIYAQNRERTREDWQTAAQTAGELLTAFRKEEKRIQSRVSPTQTVALQSVQNEYNATRLTPEQMNKRIAQTAAPDEWQTQFNAWLQPRVVSESAA